MLALAFLHPLLLWGLPLCAVPIVIHLLNRRRFHKVPWAAMEFLLAAMKRNRKRLRMEQWLVLLLRTLAVLLLVFLVSRPQLGGGTFLGTVTHHVVVLDDSASMTQRSGSARLFERAQDRVKLLVEELAAQRGGDLFSLVRTSRAATPEPWSMRVGPELGTKIGAMLKEATVTDGAPDLGAVLQLTGKRAMELKEAGRTHYYLVSDQRAHDWVTDDERPRPALLAALGALRADKDQLTVLGSGGPAHNLAVVDVRHVDRLAVAGVPTTLAVDVQNLGLDPSAPTTLALEVDGQSRIVLTVPQLAPGQRQALPVGHTFHQAGHHRIDAGLEATETFPLDDRRTLALEVRDKSRVLLVDGQPDEDQGETFFLQAAMELPETGIEPQVVSESGLEEADLAQFDVVWLCNVQAPTAAVAKRLEQFVAEGGGLVLTVGAQTDGQRWNELLWRDGQGPLPMPYGEIAGDVDKPVKAALVKPDHAICSGVAEIVDLLVGNVVLVKRWLTLTEDPADRNAAVVLRVRDAEGPPMLATRTFGSGGGEVVQFAITADTFWCNLPSTDLFVVLANQIHRAAARRRDLASANLQTDGSYRLSLDPAVYRADVTVRATLGDDERTFTAVEPPAPKPAAPPVPDQPAPAAAPGHAHLELVVPMGELRQLGGFTVELGRHDGTAETRVFARNAPIAESRLLPFLDTAFTRLFPPDLHGRVRFVREGNSLGDGTGEGELWHLLAVLLLVGLLLETVLAWRFGRR